MFWIFFQESNSELYDKLKSSKTDIAYRTEMFSKFNEGNLQLQGDETSLIKAKSALSAFLYSRNIGRHEFRQFPYLSELEKKTGVKDSHEFRQFPYLSELEKKTGVKDIDIANPSRRGTCKFAKWRVSETKVQNLLPSLLDANSDPKTLPNPVERHQVVFFIAFPISYLVKRGFSTVSRLLTKQRNKLTITERGDLKLLLTKLHPDVDSLIAMHQAHPSHLAG